MKRTIQIAGKKEVKRVYSITQIDRITRQKDKQMNNKEPEKKTGFIKKQAIYSLEERETASGPIQELTFCQGNW